MGLFGIGKKKKSKEEEELEDDDDLDEEEERDEKRKKKLADRKKFSKRLRDLNPDEAKKRKEPIKPWGRGERMWVIMLLLVTTAVSGFLALRARNYKVGGLPRIQLPSSFSAIGNIFKGETIVIEGDSFDNGRSKATLDEVNDITRKLSGIYGVYVIRLNDDSSYGINENETFLAASMMKVPVMLGMYMHEQSSDFSLNKKYKLRESDKLPGAGSLSGRPAGYEITYRNLVRLMGKESDNTAFNICRNFLGETKINEIIKDLGMTDTNFSENETTPRDMGVLFKKIWMGNLIPNKERDELLSYITGTLYESWLPEGVPSNIKVSHKVGIETHILNDGGIVHADNPYVLVMMSKGIVEKQAEDALPEISKTVFEAESIN